MTVWLDVLRVTIPPEGVLLVGAGGGDGPWVQWLQGRDVATQSVRVHLIEGDEQRYRHLQASLPADEGWISRCDVVAPASGSAHFYRASNPAESGLLAPETLQELWPHLSIEQPIMIEDALTLDELEQECEGHINWLVLDCLPAARLLRGGARMLAGVDVALLRVIAGDASEILRVEPLAGQPAADEVLRAAGFRRIYMQAERHPAVAHALYVRDTIRYARTLSEQLQVAQEAWAKERAELCDAEKKARRTAQDAEEAKVLAQTQAQKLSDKLRLVQEIWAKEKAELMKAREAADQKAEAAEQAEAVAQEQTHKLSEQLKAAQEAWTTEENALALAKEAADQRARIANEGKALAQEQVQELSERLRVAQEAWANERAELVRAKEAADRRAEAAEQAKVLAQEHVQMLNENQFDVFQQSVKELRANFNKDLGNAVKQIEAFLFIQNYLNASDGISGFHGWAINPDVGLLLIERIRERNYDLIIEFGSGISTVLFAKTLQLQRRPISAVLAATNESARPICSFEHDQVYLRKTQDMLVAHGLTRMVTLNHAPLLDWIDDTGRYLHYDCDAALAALGEQLAGARKRVLVLVDGPPGATCPNARYPAVPKIFKHLARHEIDLVLDDANRTEEKAVIELWRAYWKQRAMRVKDGAVPSEKGLYWARNYEQ